MASNLLYYESGSKYAATTIPKYTYSLNKDYKSTNHLYTRFDRFYTIYPHNELTNVCQYVFMVRPDLCILDQNGNLQNRCKNHMVMNYMNNDYPEILKQITRYGSTKHDFIPYLVGRTESVQIPDYGVKVYTVSQPYSNLSVPYAIHGMESLSNGTFEITFREDKNLSIHKMFHTWITYIDGVSRNIFTPFKQNLQGNVLDYATSVYVITCAPDAKTILFWSKYTGAIPQIAPNSDFSFNRLGDIKNTVDISFSYFLGESLNPAILYDFNINAGISNPDREIENAASYNAETMSAGYALMERPFIYRNRKTKSYELHWLH